MERKKKSQSARLCGCNYNIKATGLLKNLKKKSLYQHIEATVCKLIPDGVMWLSVTRNIRQRTAEWAFLLNAPIRFSQTFIRPVMRHLWGMWDKRNCAFSAVVILEFEADDTSRKTSPDGKGHILKGLNDKKRVNTAIDCTVPASNCLLISLRRKTCNGVAENTSLGLKEPSLRYVRRNYDPMKDEKLILTDAFAPLWFNAALYRMFYTQPKTSGSAEYWALILKGWLTQK